MSISRDQNINELSTSSSIYNFNIRGFSARLLRFLIDQSLVWCMLICVCLVLAYQVNAINYVVQYFEKMTHVKSFNFLAIWTSIVSTYGYKIIFSSLFWVCTPLLLLLWLYFRNQHFDPKRFIVIYCLMTLLLGGVYIFFVNVVVFSDFERLWTYATLYAKYGISHDMHSFTEQRSLVVLYPLIKLFGPHTLVIKIVNLLQVMSIGLMGYHMQQKYLGHKAAQAFVLCWFVSLEPLMAIVIPTHDLWGLFFLTLGLWLTSFALIKDTRLYVIFIIYALVGVLSAVIEQQRGYGIFFLVAVILSGLYYFLLSSRKLWTLILLILVLGGSCLMTKYIQVTEGLLISKRALDVMVMKEFIAGSTSFSPATYQYVGPFSEAFGLTFEDKQSKDLVRSVILSDVVEQPIKKRILNISYRLSKLAQPFQQEWFYLNKTTDNIRNFAVFSARLSALAVFSLSFISLLLLFTRRKLNVLTATSILFAGITLSVFCLITEVQPRYAFFMWMIACMLIGEAFSLQDKGGEDKNKYLASSETQRLSNSKVKRSVIFIVFLIGVIASGLSLYYEVYPKITLYIQYFMLLWLFAWIAIYTLIANSFRMSNVSRQSSQDDFQIIPMNNPWKVLASIIIILSVYMVWNIFNEKYTFSKGKIIASWNLNITSDLAPSERQRKILLSLQRKRTGSLVSSHYPINGSPDFGALSFSLQLPMPFAKNDTVIANKWVCADLNQALTFYVSTADLNLDHKGASNLILLQNGHELWSTFLPVGIKPLLITVPLAPQAKCSQLEFKLVSLISGEDTKAQDNSRVEIIFPRLISTGSTF